jgi:hypothetical protein
MRGDVGDFLADAGQLSAAGRFSVPHPDSLPAVVHDFRPAADPERWAQIWGSLGGVAGLVVLVAER